MIYAGDKLGRDKEKRNAWERKWRAENRERLLEYRKEYYRNNPERFARYRRERREYTKAYNKKYQAEHRDELLAKQRIRSKERQHRTREEVLEHYGGKCECCGESHHEFLALDHKDGDGAEHRRKVKSNIYWWTKKMGYPDNLRLLCHNCNQSISWYGYCPHERR